MNYNGIAVSGVSCRGIIRGIWYSAIHTTPDIYAVIYSVVRLSGLSGAVCNPVGVIRGGVFMRGIIRGVYSG